MVPLASRLLRALDAYFRSDRPVVDRHPDPQFGLALCLAQPQFISEGSLERECPVKSADRCLLFFAQGLGSGRLPFAPGTGGSIVGIGWTWLLISSGSLGWFLFGTIALLIGAIWICGQAEKILGAHDPGSVVLDEIAALPVCFLPLVVMEVLLRGGLDPVGHFGLRNVLLGLAAGFALFRLFDIWKPGPIRVAQRLPGGLGVVIDDFFAALAVALVLPWLALGVARFLV